MNHWKKHDLGHFRLSSKSSIFPPVIYSVPRAPPQARAHNLPPAARGFIALGLIKSPLTATEVCSPPHREGIAATSCGRALTPGLPSAPGNAGAITHLCPGRRRFRLLHFRRALHFRLTGAALPLGLFPPRALSLFPGREGIELVDETEPR